jgi:hypothetical protein
MYSLFSGGHAQAAVVSLELAISASGPQLMFRETTLDFIQMSLCVIFRVEFTLQRHSYNIQHKISVE